MAGANGPPAQVAAPMCYDLARDRCWLVGEAATGVETWGFDGAQWNLALAAGPGDVRGAAMVFDLQHAAAVWYGGIPASASSVPNTDVTFTWDGATWTQLAPAQTPGGLARMAMAFDLARGRTVLYGGSRSVWTNVISADTWEFDGVNWTLVPGAGPGPRERAAMCHLPGTGAVVLFGGDGPLGANDETWRFDGVQWQLVPVVGPRPVPRTDACMVADEFRSVAVLVGGRSAATGLALDDTWEFDGVAWRQVWRQVSPPRSEAAAAFDLVRHRAFLFGGVAGPGDIRSDTWQYGATQQTFSQGCVGTFGRPTLFPGAPPSLGAIGSVTLQNLDPNAALAGIALGWSGTQWAFGALPASLAFLGMPSCVAYSSADELRVIGASGGAATWTFAVPSDPLLFGLQAFVQGISLDPSRNAFGAVTSNLDVMTVGW